MNSLQAENNININLFSALNRNIKDPFIVLDHSGNILSLNEQAESLFNLSGNRSNFYKLFDSQTSDKIKKLIEQIISETNFISENIILSLKSGTEINSEITLSCYQEENELFVFCSIKKIQSKLEPAGTTEVKVVTQELAKIIRNKSVLSIIEDIKSLYPFTFIGKEKVLKGANKLEELFWIKDSKGIYVLINKALSKGLGLRTTLVEGKSASSFIPAYLVGFYEAIETYIRDSVNVIMIEGIPIKGISAYENYQTIEIPLVDSDNNLIATIGIAQRKISKNDTEWNEILFGSKLDMLVNWPEKVAILDKDGNFKHGSKDFCKLFSLEIKNLRENNFRNSLPENLIQKVNEFLESSVLEEKFEINSSAELEINSKEFLEVFLNKIYDKENDLVGFSVVIKEKQNFDDVENFINSRGRMFEILIQNNPEPIFIYDTENLRFLEVNDSALSLYGYRKDEFLQMDLTDLYTPEDIQTLLDSSSSTKEGTFSGPFRHKKKDGSSVFVEISKITFTFQDREAHFNIIKDVSANLDLEKKLQLFKSAFNNTDDVIFITDNTGIIKFVNQAALKKLDKSKNDLENISFTSLVKDEERGSINSSIFRSHLKDEVTIFTELKSGKDEFINVELNATPILDYNEEIDSYTILCKIQVEPVEPKEIIKEVIKEVVVEKEVPSKTPVTNADNSAFLSSMFHEILTPINVILGFVEELTDGISDKNKDQKEAADIINQNRERLLSTMNSVLEYSNIQQNKIDLNVETVAITQVIDQLQQDISDIVGSRNIEFGYGKISSSLSFETDRNKFQSLISQLFRIVTHISREKKIYFSAYQLNDDSFIIAIKDNYNSISRWLMENLIGLFTKGEAGLSKDFGIPKLTVQLATALLKILKGNVDTIQNDNEKVECGFIFPININEYADFNSLRSSEFESDTQEDIEENISEEVFEESVQNVTEDELDSEEQIDHEEEPDYSFPDFSDEDEEVSSSNSDDFEYIESKLNHEIQIPEENDDNSIEEDQEINEEPVADDKETEIPYYSPKNINRLDLSNLNCLYIEDQVDSQILFKVQMKELKEIKFAVSFEEALPLLDTEHFDFIVMDINLQGEYNGLDALKIVHKMPEYQNIPIIAVTAYVLPGDKEKFIAVGFNDFISKPIFKEKMVDSLEKIFLPQI